MVAVALLGCGRLDYEGGDRPDAAIDAGSLDAGSRDAGTDAGSGDAGAIDGSTRDGGAPDAGAVDAGPIDAGARDAGPVDGGRTDAPAGDAGPCEDPFELAPTSDALVESVVAAAAMPTGDRGEESGVLLYVAASCFDPADPTPFILAVEMDPAAGSHPVHVTYGGGGGWLPGLGETARTGLDFPGDSAAVRDAFDAWGGAPGRYYTAAFPSVPCAGCEGGVSYNYFVYPATGRIGVAFGGWSR